MSQEFKTNLDKIKYFKETQPLLIVGVLILKSKYKYGKNSRGVEKYLFKPFDYKLPNFIVASKIKGENEYIIVKPIDKEFNENPYGENAGFDIGKVSNLNYTKKALFYYYKLNFKKYKGKIPTITYSPVEIKDNIISIDPTGCRDIDDAVSYGGNKLKIYLADTTEINMNIFNNACKQCTTVYTDDKIQHMLPEKMMESCSLLKNLFRRANVCEINIDSNYNITDVHFYQKIIKVNENYSYQEADNENLPYINTIMDIVENINFNYNQHNGSRSHKVIEKLMVMVNNLVVKELLKTNKQFIIRKHTKNNSNITVPPIFSNFYDIYTSNSAEYVLYDKEHKHSGLGIKQYTHFTSPLRRLVDLVNHLILFTDKIFTNVELQNICTNCNEINKRIKKYDIECKKLNLLNIDTDYDITYDGYIIDFIDRKDLPIKIKFYIPSLDIVLNQDTYNYKLKTIYKTKLSENKDKLTLTKDNVVTEYILFQKIVVSLHKRPDEINPSKKLKFEIF